MSLSHIFYLLLSTGLCMSLKLFVAQDFLQVTNKWGREKKKPLQRCNILVSVLSLVSLLWCTIKLAIEVWFCKLKVISLHI